MNEIIIKYKGRKIKFNVRKAKGLNRIFGLMFRSKKTGNLLFEFDKDVKISFHSLFVFFPFLILFLDGENKVIDYEIVRPFKFWVDCRKSFKKVIEIPLNDKNKEIISFFRRGKI